MHGACSQCYKCSTSGVDGWRLFAAKKNQEGQMVYHFSNLSPIARQLTKKIQGCTIGDTNSVVRCSNERPGSSIDAAVIQIPRSVNWHVAAQGLKDSACSSTGIQMEHAIDTGIKHTWRALDAPLILEVMTTYASLVTSASDGAK